MPNNIDNDFRDIDPDFPVVQTLLREGFLSDALTAPNAQQLRIDLHRNVQGEVQSADIDTNADRKPDKKFYFGRDPMTREVNRVDIDANADGKLDDLMLFKRSLHDQTLQSVTIDRGRNGSIDETWNYFRARQGTGQITGMKFTKTGQPNEYLTMHRMGPGVEGVLNYITRDADGDSKVDNSMKFNHNQDGLYSMNINRNADGTYDGHLKINRNQYKDIDKILIDRNGDTKYDGTLTFRRDIHHRLTALDMK